jgi:pilus assembly protein Flp/PilA
VSIQRTIARLFREEDGQDLIEYALLAGFISLVAIAAVITLGGGVNSVFQGIEKKVKTIPTE